MNRHEEARDLLERLHQAASGNTETYLVLGKVYNELDQLEQAVACLERAAGLAPKRVDILYSLATVYAKLGQTGKAAEYRTRFENLKSRQLRSESGMGVRDKMRDDVFLPGHLAQIMTFVGKAYLEHGSLELAEKCLLRAAALNALDRDCREALSELCDGQGRWEEALRWVGELRRIEPENVLHDRNEGLLYGRLNRFDEAEEVFRDVCRLVPEQALGYVGLAELYLRTGRDPAEGKSFAEKAVELEPTVANGLVLAALAERAGRLASIRPGSLVGRRRRSAPGRTPTTGGCLRPCAGFGR